MAEEVWVRADSLGLLLTGLTALSIVSLLLSLMMSLSFSLTDDLVTDLIGAKTLLLCVFLGPATGVGVFAGIGLLETDD